MIGEQPQAECIRANTAIDVFCWVSILNAISLQKSQLIPSVGQ